MAVLRSYRVTVLLHPQVSGAERSSVESLLRAWPSEHGGELRTLTTDDSRSLAYPVKHQAQATILRAALAVARGDPRDLLQRLAGEKAVLRSRLFAGERGEGKRLSDLPPKRPEIGEKKGEAKTLPAKEKAPLEKLEEKIDEILKEEVL